MSTQTESYQNTTSVEINTIQEIPDDQRHGHPRDLFTIWFGSNIMLLTIITGTLAISIFHLSFVWAVIAVLIGNLLGGFMMALHSAQGGQLGVPQMVQTRGQFGSYGSLFVVALVIIMYIGFLASNLVLGGQSIHAVYSKASVNLGIVLLAILSLLATAVGYRLIHAYTRVMSWVSGLALLAGFIWIFFVRGVPDNFLSINGFSMVGFLGAVSIAALWELAYAPYVSDYSRYMPKNVSSSRVFVTSYLGCVLGSFFPMVLGIVIALVIGGDDAVTGLHTILGAIAPIVIIIFTVGIASSNAMNLYCGVLCTLTLGQTLFPKFSPLARGRMITALILTVIEVVIGLVGQSNFIANYTNFILLLLYVLVPWTAINLTDYYLVAHGKYDVKSFFKRDGGIYGYFNKKAMFCYVLGILVEIPFMSTDIYTGPVARYLGGADISWIVGIVVIVPIYYLLDKFAKTPNNQPGVQ